MRFVIRSPQLSDAQVLGRVHVRAWRAAYRGGLMPDEYLDGLSEADRAAMWHEALRNEPQPRAGRFVAESESGDLVGFALVGPAEREPVAKSGELYAINVDPDHWGSGAGGSLLTAAVDALRAAAFADAVLWVHPRNERARMFYESRGWRCDGIERLQDVLGVTVPEVRYSTTF